MNSLLGLHGSINTIIGIFPSVDRIAVIEDLKQIFSGPGQGIFLQVGISEQASQPCRAVVARRPVTPYPEAGMNQSNRYMGCNRFNLSAGSEKKSK